MWLVSAALGASWAVDADGDAVEAPPEGLDCDDGDPARGTGFVRWADTDLDGFGDPLRRDVRCTATEAGWVADAADCDDDDPDTRPDADEDCAEGDRNCDGLADAGAVDAPPWFRDVDADGWGTDLGPTVVACDAPAGFVADAGDCDDDDDRVAPEAADTCGDGVDADCVDGDPRCPPGAAPPDPGCGCATRGGGLPVLWPLAWRRRARRR